MYIYIHVDFKMLLLSNLFPEAYGRRFPYYKPTDEDWRNLLARVEALAAYCAKVKEEEEEAKLPGLKW